MEQLTKEELQQEAEAHVFSLYRDRLGENERIHVIKAFEAGYALKLPASDELTELKRRLYLALDALGGMYCQYTPGTFGHDFMSAGEDAQDVLLFEKLLDNDYNFIGLPSPESFK